LTNYLNIFTSNVAIRGSVLGYISCNNYYFAFLFCILSVFAQIDFLLAKDNGPNTISFVVLGHLYPIVADDIRLSSLLNDINSRAPNYVFILGDSSLQNSQIVDTLRSTIDANLFFVPGNQEISIDKNQYLTNIGYLNKTMLIEGKYFILINSSDSADNIRSYLETALIDVSIEDDVYLFSHHRIWDDTLISKQPDEHDKSYYFDELYPILKEKVDVIFAGNSKRQYFSDLSENDSANWGSQNVNTIFWVDMIGNIACYSVGMGDGTPKSTYVLVDASQDHFTVTPHFTSTEKYDVLPRDLLQPHINSSAMLKDLEPHQKRQKIYNEIFLILEHRYFWYGIVFLAGSILILLIVVSLSYKFRYRGTMIKLRRNFR